RGGAGRRRSRVSRSSWSRSEAGLRLRTILKCNQGTGRPPAVSRAVQGPAGCGRGPRDRGGIRPRASGRRHAVQRAVGVRPLRGGGGGDGPDGGGQVAAVALEGGLEEVEAVVVEPARDEGGVVERRREEAAEGVAAERRLDLGPEAVPGVLEDDLAAGEDRVAGEVGAGVELLEACDQVLEEAREEQVVRPAVLRDAAAAPVVALDPAEEGDGAAIADEAGEALVEGDLARHEEGVVRELVDDGGDEVHVVGPEQRGEERVVEPAQGAEGGRGAD